MKKSEKMENCTVRVTVEVFKANTYQNMYVASSTKEAKAPMTAREAIAAVRSMSVEAKDAVVESISGQIEEDEAEA